MDSIKIRKADDMHIHLRQGVEMRSYAQTVEKSVGRVLVMPNTLPPITTAGGLDAYRDQIRKAAPDLVPLMTFKLSVDLTAEMTRELKRAGAIAGKLYPEGVTTNSEDGIRDIADLYPIFAEMELTGLVLCIHGESPFAPVLEREAAFLPTLVDLSEKFPDLRIVFEHVSTRDAVELIAGLPGTVAATVTVHHLLFTLDDMLANGLNPHLYCKPLIKGEPDRAAIRRVVLEGNPRFFYGSDSAPHPQNAKEKPLSAAGVYSAPVALPLLLEFFESNGCIQQIEKFTSEYGADFYGLPLSSDYSTWVKKSWRVPGLVDGAVPLCSGGALSWQLDSG